VNDAGVISNLAAESNGLYLDANLALRSARYQRAQLDRLPRSELRARGKDVELQRLTTIMSQYCSCGTVNCT